MASTAVPAVPAAKNVVVFKNGDPFFTGRKLVVNQRQILTFETFLNEVTSNIQAAVAVRNIYTPSGGHRVLDLPQLHNGSHYVAAGFERFKKIDYLQKRNQKPNGNRRKNGAMTRVDYSCRRNVSGRWRKCIHMPCIVNPFQLPSLPRLYTTEGQVMVTGTQLQNGYYYVAVGSERFKNLPYLELLVSKMSSLNALRHQQMMRHRNRGKEGAISQDGVSDSALVASPAQQDLDKRRVQSMGAAEAGVLVSPQPVRRRGKSVLPPVNSIFFAKPVKVKLKRHTAQESPASGNKGKASSSQRQGPRIKVLTHFVHPVEPVRASVGQCGPVWASVEESPMLLHSLLPFLWPEVTSVFKVSEERAELHGALEIADDENTKVELPVDKRAAEVIEDEIIVEDGTHHIEGVTAKPQ
ncbi:doublecortin domain-containing protein 2B [Leucoraja erinacea]|uniref:doublecortin domain-containing protein 2B n=1 Tax=Leucoraja erinaceus TaxID=7782 RepID=UPI0024550C2A|nr:doublecortin domain-containing protein 2B [Leucoraja erinacea]